MSKAGIIKWLKDKGIEPDTVDVEGEYDSNESYSWNLKHIKTLLKTGKARRTQKDYDTQFCSFANEECSRGNKEACITACKECGTHCKPTKKKGAKALKKAKPKAKKKVTPMKDVRRIKKKKKCRTKVKVKKHTRRCPSTGKFLK